MLLDEIDLTLPRKHWRVYPLDLGQTKNESPGDNHSLMLDEILIFKYLPVILVQTNTQ